MHICLSYLWYLTISFNFSFITLRFYYIFTFLILLIKLIFILFIYYLYCRRYSIGKQWSFLGLHFLLSIIYNIFVYLNNIHSLMLHYKWMIFKFKNISEKKNIWSFLKVIENSFKIYILQTFFHLDMIINLLTFSLFIDLKYLIYHI